MAKNGKQFLQGFLTAMGMVAEITGKQPIDEMSDREWKLICELNARLAGRAAAEAEQLNT